MSDTLTTAYNRQIGMELESSHAYLQLAAFFADQSLTGFEQWMRVQAEEERAHAIKFFDFVLDRGRQVQLGDISGPEGGPTTALEAFEMALDQEQKVTQAIENLLELAQAEGDSASYPLLQWFLNEQIEEEASVGEIVDQLRFANGNPAAVLMLDRERATRSPEQDA